MTRVKNSASNRNNSSVMDVAKIINLNCIHNKNYRSNKDKVSSNKGIGNSMKRHCLHNTYLICKHFYCSYKLIKII